jgi:hypothetical protein
VHDFPLEFRELLQFASRERLFHLDRAQLERALVLGEGEPCGLDAFEELCRVQAVALRELGELGKQLGVRQLRECGYVGLCEIHVLPVKGCLLSCFEVPARYLRSLPLAPSGLRAQKGVSGGNVWQDVK